MGQQFGSVGSDAIETRIAAADGITRRVSDGVSEGIKRGVEGGKCVKT